MGPFNPGVIALMIPIIIFMIPIVAILTSHQQKMAELMSRNRAPEGTADIDALRREVAELKQLIHQQAIAMDNLVALQTRQMPSVPDQIQARIG
jgi:hypothetical protein